MRSNIDVLSIIKGFRKAGAKKALENLWKS